MNVQCLGEDVCYDGWFSRRAAQARSIGRRAGLFGDDVIYGSGLDSLGLFVKNLVTGDVGKSAGAAALNTIAGKLSPTQKAQVAQIQDSLGIQALPVSNATPNLSEAQKPSYTPYLIGGGVALVAGYFMLKTMKRRR
jgi:hypothetical protein